MEETTPTPPLQQEAPAPMASEAPVPPAPAPLPPKEEKAAKPEGNLQGVIAYVPFLFIVAALQRLEDKDLMFHAKNGAGLTLVFIIASFVSAWIHVWTGTLLMILYVIPAAIGAFHGWKNERWMIPGVSVWAQNIPLDHWFSAAHEKNVQSEVPTAVAETPVAPSAPAEPIPPAPSEPVETKETITPPNPPIA